MTVKMHMFYQALLTVGQILNLASGFVPPKYQPFVALAITLVQAALGWYNHNYNPDGTPASIAYVAKLLLLCFLFSGGAIAQTQKHFTLSGQAISFMSTSGTTLASIADGYVNLTKNFSIGYQQITLPGVATARLGVGDYDRTSCDWLGKKLSAKLVIDCSKVQIDVFAGGGKLNQSVLNVNRIAETAGGCISYSLSANVSAQLVCGQWLHGGIVNGFLTNGSVPGLTAPPNSNNASVSSGIAVHF